VTIAINDEEYFENSFNTLAIVPVRLFLFDE